MSTAWCPSQGPCPDPVLAARVVSCYHTSLVLFSLPLYRSPAQFPTLIRPTSALDREDFLQRGSCSHQRDPGKWAPDHRTTGLEDAGASVPAGQSPHLVPMCPLAGCSSHLTLNILIFPQPYIHTI